MRKTLVLTLALLILAAVFTAPAYALGEPWEEIGTLPDNVSYAMPTDTACDAAGNLYVSDSYYHRIKRYTSDGVLDTSWCDDGILGGVFGSLPNDFDTITDITVDANGNLYTAESGSNHRVKRYTPDGVLDLSWGGGDGIIGGRGSAPNKLDQPYGLAVDSSGNLYIADSSNNRVVRYTSGGTLDTTWCGDGIIGPTGSGITSLQGPRGVGIDASDNLYVADVSGVRRYTSDPSAQDGDLDAAYSGDGIISGSGGAGDDQHASIIDIVVTPAGRLFVMDNTVEERVLCYTDAGYLDTSWGGDAMIGGSGFGAGQFMLVCGGSVDPSGLLYVAENIGRSVERYTADGVLDTSWCNGGSMGTYGNDPDKFMLPEGAATDPDGNVYISDYFNHRIKRYAPSGNIDTSWGGGDGIIGNMPGSGVDQFNYPVDVATDAHGRLYITDTNNHRIVRYTSGGVLDTSWAAGGMIVEADGDGATENRFMSGIAVDSDGYIYVCDSTLSRVKRYTPAGSLDTSWASGGILGGTGVLTHPLGIAVDTSGNLYIADSNNDRVMRCTPDGELDLSWGGGDGVIEGVDGPIDVEVNPVTGELYIMIVYNKRLVCYDSDGTSPRQIMQFTEHPETRDVFGTNIKGIAFSQGSLYATCNFQSYVRVLYDVENGLKLSGLTVGGSAVSSFHSDTLTCSVIVPQSATEVTIGADTVYTTSSVSGTGTRALSSGSTDFTLTVTAKNGDTQDYTLSVLRNGSDVGLDSLTVDGQAVSGFSESKTSYTVTAPYGARYVDIGATGNSYTEDVTGTGVQELTGDSTTFSVIARADDGSAKEYTLTVKKGSAPSIWAKLFADGTELGTGILRISVPQGGKSVILTIKLSDGSEKSYELALSQASGSGGEDPPTDDPPDENIPDTGDTSADTAGDTSADTASDTSANDTSAQPAADANQANDIADSAADVSADASDAHGSSPAFPWWWIPIGILAAGTIGFGSWVLLLKRRA